MKTTFKITLVMLFLICFSACDESAVEFGSVIELEEGMTVVMADKSVISLTEVNDSRCPIDATCVWEGRAEAVIKIESPNVEDEVILNDVEKSDFELSDYRFEFVELTPFPDVNATSTASKVLKFKISLN
ncbi:MAG: hypothetical protein Roseis2KO_00700 [Roseivirga sp.]